MRRLFCLLAAAVLGLGLLAPAPKASAEEPDPISPATTHLYSCLQTAHSVSVLFVLDKSGSLRFAGKDPDGLRYDGLASALSGLSKIKRSDEQRIDVEAAIAGFSDIYVPAAQVAPWQRINGEDSATVIDQMVRQARTRLTPKGDTDFQRALEGGYADFDVTNRSADCRIMFWFTDGEFTSANGENLRDNNTVAGPLIERARADMCAPSGGVIDRLRSSGVVILGIQLGPIAPDLKRMSIGILGDTTCGTWPIPDGWVPGGYLQVDSADNLNWVFSQMNDLATGCTPTGDIGNHIDPGIGKMMVRIPRTSVITPVPDSEPAVLIAPDGHRLEFTVPGTHTAGLYQVESSHDAGQLGARVTLPAGAPAGAWSVAEPASHGNLSFCVWSDIVLTADPSQPQLTAEQPGQIRAIATRPDGTAADLSVYREVALTAEVTTAHGERRTAPARIDGGTIVVDVTPGELDPRLDLTLTATPVTASGLRLSPITAAWSLPVHSDRFPSVQPADRLDLGTINRTETGRAQLVLTGAKLGPSKVCLTPGGEFTSPVEGEGNRLVLSSECVDLQPGQRSEVEVSFTPSQQAIGPGRSTLTVTLTAAAAEGQQPQSVDLRLPVSWYQSVPVNVATFALTLGTLIVLSVLLMGFAVWLAMFLTTKFNTKGLRHAQARVQVTSNSIQVLAPAEADRPRGMHPLPAAADSPLFDKLQPYRVLNPRLIKLGDVTLQAYTPLLPGDAPRFTAYVPDTHLIEANSSRVALSGGTLVPVTPGLGLLVIITTSAAAAAAAPNGGPVEATLHLLTTDKHLTPDAISQAVKGLQRSGFLSSWQRADRLAPPQDTPTSRLSRPPFRRSLGE